MAARSAKDPNSPIAPSDQEAEQRRLGEAIRTLAADRDRLLARLSTLERNLEEVTGSIAAAAAHRNAAASCRVAARRGIAAAAPALPPPPSPTAPSPSRVAAGHLATGSPAAAESVATKTEFGVDLGGNASIEGMRALWTHAEGRASPALLEGLRPVIAVREGQKAGSLELRLVAGPLPNASIAARLCAALAPPGQACQPAVFDGQRLALQ